MTENIQVLSSTQVIDPDTDVREEAVIPESISDFIKDLMIKDLMRSPDTVMQKEPRTPQIYTFLAILDDQPQEVTFMVDLLLQHGYSLESVIVIHPSVLRPSLQDALSRLTAEFASGYYQTAGHLLPFRSYVLQSDGSPLGEIKSAYDADHTLNALHHLIHELKSQKRHIHLSLSKGQLVASVLATTIAQVNFDRKDHIWYIHIPEQIKSTFAEQYPPMHVSSEEVNLIEIPFVAWGAYLPDFHK